MMIGSIRSRLSRLAQRERMCELSCAGEPRGTYRRFATRRSRLMESALSSMQSNSPLPSWLQPLAQPGDAG